MNSLTATYRLQLTGKFPFAEAEKLLPTLHKLGISDLYLSPIFHARPGSTHGYDVLNMNLVNPELGGREGFDRFAARASALGMGIILDIVPNHRGFFSGNLMLMDIFENGPSSRFYQFFDVDWGHPYQNIRGRLLAPFLGDFYGRVLERGELKLSFGPEGFRINYWDLSLPVSLATWPTILSRGIDGFRRAPGLSQPDMFRYLAVIRFLEGLEAERFQNPQFDYGGFVREVLWELCETSPPVRAHIDHALAEFNSEGVEPRNYDLLDGLLARQYYRLAFWKVGTQELNYRRFFSVNDLISLRMEREEVFLHTHQLIRELFTAGQIRGVRVDHIDGLYNPSEYLDRLRELLPGGYLVVEKILEPAEELPDYWPVEGTSGYEFMDHATGVLCDSTTEAAMDEAYVAFTDMESSFEDLVRENKRGIIGRHMAGDIENLAISLKAITNRNRQGNDLTMYSIRRALVEILTVFPIYRTYVTPGHFTDRDREVLETAIARARKTAPHYATEIDFIGGALLGATCEKMPESERCDWVHFLMKLQQYTGSLMAKGVEDTAFYLYNRLVARNEVGSSPVEYGYEPERYLRFCEERAARWPTAMNATSTHDTKRGEDTRARLAVLSEIPAEWASRVEEWHRLNAPHRQRERRRQMPSRNDEWLLFQTLVGAMPYEGPEADDFPARVEEYMVKAAREAKLETNWLTPNEGYEQALRGYVKAVLDSTRSGPFLKSLREFLDRIAYAGIANSLAQTVLKCLSPGTPDVYQGAELWDLSLVDPDNRRDVDFAKREKLLREVGKPARVATLCATPTDGRLKLHTLTLCLRLRRELASLFSEGRFSPLAAEGPRSRHALTFAWQGKDSAVVVAVSRLTMALLKPGSLQPEPGAWEATRLPLPAAARGPWTNVLTGEEIPAGSEVDAELLFATLPVAVLRTATR